jgi:23S rRNA-/tRNA-specific pseudouridylate synthase
MFISHKTGKKACTHFRFLKSYGPYALWEARASFVRLHQIRYHAADEGLAIVGETLYAEEAPLYLSQFKRKYTGRDRERPLYEGLYLHLAELRMPFWGNESITIEYPKKFEVMLKKLESALKK